VSDSVKHASLLYSSIKYSGKNIVTQSSNRPIVANIRLLWKWMTARNVLVYFTVVSIKAEKVLKQIPPKDQWLTNIRLIWINCSQTLGIR
jgi:hypothetical protein